ncbi:uncharacterized protein A1O9_11503 [Exophiala aquamarina CBS 119918]|uniref:FAD-binding domain-containing protein n=1 Tax=Exophiala aquamarina CBS 119918 TaxID=1182545 RepID=A0A072NZ44_9EURO|nr:uncharacterized protein A1O9_11503 [Exophiala aquamarina CBS 119918]KEF52263.1 hypothetical protein A1O9_11503 [Exophiala aquamarina CBS 119918]
MQLNIIVVGAGLGGLSAAICLARKGHKVTVLERNAGLSEYGAGIQLSPNATRLLDAWNLSGAFREYCNVPKVSVARRFADDAEIGLNHQNPDASEVYGYPYWQIYRPDCQRLLSDGARRAGAAIEYKCEVLKIDAEKGTVYLANGQVLVADVVVCADGIRSKMRGFLVGNDKTVPVPLGEYNYRAMIPAEAMMRDEETAKLMASTDTQAWFGPSRFLVGYPISNNTRFNLAMVAPLEDDTPVTAWNHPGDTNELRAQFSDFSPLVQKLTGLVEQCAKWMIAEIPKLNAWSSRSGRIVLLGDAAHAMSPHAAQGGAMAMEDAAVLGEVLSTLTTLEDLPRLAGLYESLRKPRVERVAAIAKGNGKAWMLHDGPEQMERDSRFRRVTDDYLHGQREVGREKMAERLKVPADANAKWPQPAMLMWLYGYDAMEAVNQLLQGSS